MVYARIMVHISCDKLPGKGFIAVVVGERDDVSTKVHETI